MLVAEHRAPASRAVVAGIVEREIDRLRRRILDGHVGFDRVRHLALPERDLEALGGMLVGRGAVARDGGEIGGVAGVQLREIGSTTPLTAPVS